MGSHFCLKLRSHPVFGIPFLPKAPESIWCFSVVVLKRSWVVFLSLKWFVFGLLARIWCFFCGGSQKKLGSLDHVFRSSTFSTFSTFSHLFFGIPFLSEAPESSCFWVPISDKSSGVDLVFFRCGSQKKLGSFF